MIHGTSRFPPEYAAGLISGIAVRNDAVVDPYRPRALAEAPYKSAVISHPGQWVAACVGESDRAVWVVSMYGLWEGEAGDIYAEATLHRAISDLTPLLQDKNVKRLVLAGDLNIWRDYGGKPWVDRYKTVFDRLAAYDLELAGPNRVGGVPLDGCPCRGGALCTHVRTYRHQKKATGTPYQNDYMFSRGLDVQSCVALDDETCWAHSDHCAVLLDVSFP